MHSIPLTTGFILGLAGSLHCMGMCGPLLMALPFESKSTTQKFFRLLLYHGSRMLSYMLLGLIGGVAGRGLFLAGWQQALSITLGALVLFLFVQQTLLRKQANMSWLYRLYNKIQSLFSRYLKHPATPTFALLGFLNGWLPCGMLYLGVAAGISFGSVSDSMITMLGFGSGTLPALFIIHFAGRLIGPGIRKHFRKAVPVMMAITGILLILRGLNLGIPYVSPVLPTGASGVVTCH